MSRETFPDDDLPARLPPQILALLLADRLPTEGQAASVFATFATCNEIAAMWDLLPPDRQAHAVAIECIALDDTTAALRMLRQLADMPALVSRTARWLAPLAQGRRWTRAISRLSDAIDTAKTWPVITEAAPTIGTEAASIAVEAISRIAADPALAVDYLRWAREQADRHFDRGCALDDEAELLRHAVADAAALVPSSEAWPRVAGDVQ